MLLASCGATVVRVEFDDAETFQKGKLGRNLLRGLLNWRWKSLSFEYDLCVLYEGKQIVRDDIHAHLASAHVFVCDFEEHKLPHASLKTETLRKTYKFVSNQSHCQHFEIYFNFDWFRQLSEFDCYPIDAVRFDCAEGGTSTAQRQRGSILDGVRAANVGVWFSCLEIFSSVDAIDIVKITKQNLKFKNS